MKPHATTLAGAIIVTVAGQVSGALPLAPDSLALTPKQWASFACGLAVALVAAIAAWRSRPPEP